ncbi:MAG: septum site-determining protein MinC [Clostridiales bacterium]|uniref:septum site-determining protein MinC n=1 Tax=Clostridium sp. N3C TaxID=1776758 RepID=UPI00092DFD56|nr:septum site-determining protein MinC [Clostridium sp. N3C]NLZ48520.1 septum site-determining protein MinC [Clostridiales bacterium]SCN21731.1 putative septum site-determining protein MinC [Clostridium sp. N3C]
MEDRILIKGNREGLVTVIDMDKFRNFDDMLEALVEKLSRGRRFYKGSTLKITTELKRINERDAVRLRNVLLRDFDIKECIFEEYEEPKPKTFTGIYEGRTKFVRKTIRSGQRIEYPGNLVIIGDVNPGSEIQAAGNVIVLGNLKGYVRAGMGGDSRAFVAAFSLQPEILQIGTLVTRAPEDNEKPQFPEVAKIKDGSIIVEPYLPNKFL